MDVVEIAVAAGPDVVGDGEGLEAFANELNSLFATRGIQFTVDLLDGDAGSSPADIGEGVRYFYVLFGREADPAVEAAFDTALARGRQAGAAGVYTYFRTLDGSAPGQDVAAEVQAFMKRLDGELQHYWSTYGHVDALKLKVLLEIERDTGGTAVEVKDGRALFDGVEVPNLDLANVPVYANNKNLSDLRARYEELSKEIHREIPGSEQYKSLEDERKEVWGRLREVENHILAFTKELAGEEAKGMSPRLREASCLADAGDIDGAKRILEDPQRDAELARALDLNTAGIAEVNQWLREQKALADLKALQKRTVDVWVEIKAVYEKAFDVFDRSPLADTRVLYDYAIVLRDTGQPSNMHRAVEVLERMLDLLKIRRDASEHRPPHVLEAMGSVLYKTRDYEKAELFYRETSDIYYSRLQTNPTAFNQNNYATSLTRLADCLSKQSKNDEAENLCRKAVDTQRRLFKENPDAYGAHLADSLNVLTQFLPHDEAVKMSFEALSISRNLAAKNPQEHHERYYFSIEKYSGLCKDKAELDRLYREAFDFYRDLLQKDPQKEFLDRFASVAITLENRSHPNQFEKLRYERIDTYKNVATKNSDFLYLIGWCYTPIALRLKEEGRTNEYETGCVQLLDFYRELFKPENPSVRNTVDFLKYLNDYAEFLRENHRDDEAEKIYCECFEIFRALPEEMKAKQVYGNLFFIGKYESFLILAGRDNEAETIYSEIVEIYRVLAKKYLEKKDDLGKALRTYATFLERHERFDEAEALLLERLNVYRDPDSHYRFYRLALSSYAEFLNERGRFDEVNPLLSELVERYCKPPQGKYAEFYLIHPNEVDSVVKFLRKMGDDAAAEKVLRAAIDFCRDKPATSIAGSGLIAHLYRYVELLKEKGRLDEAIDVYREILDRDPENTPRIREYADLLKEVGRTGEAERIEHKLNTSPRQKQTSNNKVDKLFDEVKQLNSKSWKCLSEKKWAEAEEVARKAVEKAQGLGVQKKEYRRAHATALNYFGYTSVMCKEFDEGYESLSQAQEIFEGLIDEQAYTPDDLASTLSKILHFKALAQLNMGELSQARQLRKEAKKWKKIAKKNRK